MQVLPHAVPDSHEPRDDSHHHTMDDLHDADHCLHCVPRAHHHLTQEEHARKCGRAAAEI